MPNSIARNLHLCILKIRRPSSSPAVARTDHDFSTAGAALIRNFNSLYDGGAVDPCASESGEGSPGDVDFAAIFASQRFFFSSPGRSNSIVDSSPSPTPPESDGEPVVGGSGVAVTAYSPDPYADFRRSMEEMVEAREVVDVRANWEYLQELLLCYLELNPKSTHKFIVGAFADLIVSLMAPAASRSARDTEFSGRVCGIRGG